MWCTIIEVIVRDNLILQIIALLRMSYHICITFKG